MALLLYAARLLFVAAVVIVAVVAAHTLTSRENMLRRLVGAVNDHRRLLSGSGYAAEDRKLYAVVDRVSVEAATLTLRPVASTLAEIKRRLTRGERR